MTTSRSSALTLAGSFAGVAEDDPLPPEDRAVPVTPSTIESLYRSQAQRLKGFFSRRADRQDAADLVHDSFVRFARAEERLEEEIDEPAAYLSQIATNLLRTRARAAYHRTIAAGDFALDRNGLVADPIRQLEARDELARLQQVLAKLRPKTRRIFLAHRVDGLSYAEIAAEIGLSVKGVEWHMSKAIGQLHRLLNRP